MLNRRRVSNRERMLIRKRVILVPILLEAITFELGLTDGLESTLFRHHLNPHGAALEPLTLLALEWWFGGCTKSCLCVSFSGVLVKISSLGYVGVHEDNHHRGRPCAGAIGFSIENGTTSVGVSQKYVSCLHEIHGRRATPCTKHKDLNRNGYQDREL